MGKRKMGYNNRLTSVVSDKYYIISKKDKMNRREKTVSCSVESKILKEALIQQKEIEDEEEQNSAKAFSFLDSAAVSAFDEDVDDFSGFSEIHSEYQFDEDAINEDDERLLDAFLCKDGGPQPTLVDIIAMKLREKNAEIFSVGDLPQPKLDATIIDLYKGVGKSLSKYTVGKLPNAFKGIPSLQRWDEILYLTEPENWSPNAMYQATRIFCSNFGVDKARRFYKLVLLPRVREDIRKNKRLHFALYQALKKSLYKPAAFFKGILFPLCQSGTCNLREAVIIGSIIQKVSIPSMHSSVALLRLAEMEYCGTTSYFIKLLLEKKYALPYRVLDALVTHFTRFYDESRVMPVIWHQSLLAFVQRYKHELTKDDKDNLKMLIRKQRHKLITPEISTELDNSRTRGQKEDVAMNICAPTCVINKAIEEDRFDIPEVPMEED